MEIISLRVDTKFQPHISSDSDFKAILVIFFVGLVKEQVFDSFHLKTWNS